MLLQPCSFTTSSEAAVSELLELDYQLPEMLSLVSCLVFWCYQQMILCRVSLM